MCGILGLVTNERSRSSSHFIKYTINVLFKLSETRGRESAGIAIYDAEHETINALKCPKSASKMIVTKEYDHLFDLSFCNGASAEHIQHPVAIIGHSRLATDGSRQYSYNNQPVIKNGVVGVHNGIIVNADDLWKTYPSLKREYEVDTEIIMGLLGLFYCHSKSLITSLSELFGVIQGAASIAVLLNDNKRMILATNTGSLYLLTNRKADIHIFASEKYILKELLRNRYVSGMLGEFYITHVPAGNGCLVNVFDLNVEAIQLPSSADSKDMPGDRLSSEFTINDLTGHTAGKTFDDHTKDSTNISMDAYNRGLLENHEASIARLRRCVSCILPETFPFVEFDEQGVCNYCGNYQHMKLLGMDKLGQYVGPHRRPSGEPDCIVTFSGGRDSSYGLHYIKNVLEMNPIAYTYDWGMVTDLGRRNQARMCGKLGIEHILVSADIDRKRENIRKNVLAWLKKPELGAVPLFMAGDKQLFYHANRLMAQTGINLVILCENKLEKTSFKSGFCGIRPIHDPSKSIYALSIRDKCKLAAYYGKQYILNPSYFNASLLDTIGAFISYYFISHPYLDLYRFIKWDEKEIESTLLNEYDWEVSPDTRTTWRIGDGTVGFYNYIYYTVAGFTEHDTFRSNQCREGMLTREQALKLVNEENRPRYESIKWYLDTIGLDFEQTITAINNIAKLYLV